MDAMCSIVLLRACAALSCRRQLRSCSAWPCLARCARVRQALGQGHLALAGDGARWVSAAMIHAVPVRQGQCPRAHVRGARPACARHAAFDLHFVPKLVTLLAFLDPRAPLALDSLCHWLLSGHARDRYTV